MYTLLYLSDKCIWQERLHNLTYKPLVFSEEQDAVSEAIEKDYLLWAVVDSAGDMVSHSLEWGDYACSLLADTYDRLTSLYNSGYLKHDDYLSRTTGIYRCTNFIGLNPPLYSNLSCKTFEDFYKSILDRVTSIR